MTLDEILRLSPVLPVVVLRHPDDAVPLARALVRGGVPILEITLRTPGALGAIAAVRAEVPEAIVGAGTVLRPDDLAASAVAGAHFAVSPGATAELLRAGRQGPIPLLPGVSTPSELMAAQEAGFARLKLFPAREAGGPAMLRALAGPFPDAVFCPTGGIGVETAPEYLSLPNVACVGGSWLAPVELIAQGRWEAVTELARRAASLRRAR